MSILVILIILILIVSHFCAFLIGFNVKENKVINRVYPDYKKLREAQIKKENEKRKRDNNGGGA